ncbi:MAG: transposase [Dehalococcoidia bacterium]|nr:transposase [Dehalococcoidia bacterium]
MTATTEGRRPWFRRADVAAHCAEQLKSACAAGGFGLTAYCFMPDHVHFLVLNEREGDLVRFMHRFKQRTGWWFRNRYLAGGLKASPTDARPSLWQKSYYDHLLRRGEDVAEVVRYILENPVRAGLAATAEEYPYAWSAFGVPQPA